MALSPVTDEFLMRVADILGASSVATRAIAERDRRRGEGEDAYILWDRDRGTLLVVNNDVHQEDLNAEAEETP